MVDAMKKKLPKHPKLLILSKFTFGTTFLLPGERGAVQVPWFHVRALSWPLLLVATLEELAKVHHHLLHYNVHSFAGVLLRVVFVTIPIFVEVLPLP